MINIILENKNIDLSKIKIKKPYFVDNNNIFNIYYDDGPLLIQSPVCYLPKPYKIIDGKSLEMDIIFNDTKFLLLLDNINNFIYDTINKHFESENIKMYKITQDGEFIINIKNYNYDTIKVFNVDKLVISIQNLSKYDRIKSIFQIEKCIGNKKESWFYFKIFQILKLDHGDDMMKINNEFLFVQEFVNYEKYHKMKQLGLPYIAIQNQMKSDGLSEIEIENFSFQINEKKPPPPPPKPPPKKQYHEKSPTPPPPPPPKLHIDKNQQISKNIQQKDEKPSLKNGPPSLSEILNAKSKLKKLILK